MIDRYDIDMASAYLQGKYHRGFRIISSIDSSFDVPFDEYFFCPASCPEEVFTVYGEKTEEGPCFKDNYFGFIIRAEYELTLKEIIDPFLEEKKIFWNFTAHYFPEEFNDTCSLSDAMDINKDVLFTNIVVFVPDKKDNSYKTACREIEKALREWGIKCFFSLYAIDEKELNLIEEKSFKDFLGLHYQLDPVYKAILK